LNVGLNPDPAGSLTLTWPVAPPPAANGVSFTADWATLAPVDAAGTTLDFDFTTAATLDPSITWTRASSATDGIYTDQAGSPYNTFANNIPRLPMTGRGLVTENLVATFTNQLLNTDTPATQTLTLGVSSFTLSVIGTGSATVTPGTAVGTGFGTATPGVPLTFNITTGGTVTVTVNGSLTRFQLGRWPYSTSYLPALGVAVTRQADSGALPVGAWFNPDFGTLLVDFLKQQAPNGVFNDLPSLWTDTNNLMGMRMQGTPSLSAVAWFGNVAVGNTPFITFVPNGVVRAAFTYNRPAAMIASAVNGQFAGPPVTVSAMPTISQLKFGIGRGAALDGFVRRVRYWPRVLNVIELVNVTAPVPLTTQKTVVSWTANRPLIPGEIVRIPYRWNTSN
jgi:hypothetical protein